jgi:hypothetical protein
MKTRLEIENNVKFKFPAPKETFISVVGAVDVYNGRQFLKHEILDLFVRADYIEFDIESAYNGDTPDVIIRAKKVHDNFNYEKELKEWREKVETEVNKQLELEKKKRQELYEELKKEFEPLATNVSILQQEQFEKEWNKFKKEVTKLI